jgi:hypothetical protein
MNKIPFITIDLNSTEDSQPPFYCPFTGFKIVSENPFDDMDESQIPESVAAIWMTGDSVNFDLPVFQSLRFSFDFYFLKDTENFDECIQLIENSNPSGDFVAFQLNYYGSKTNDFGVVYILFFVPKN